MRSPHKPLSFRDGTALMLLAFGVCAAFIFKGVQRDDQAVATADDTQEYQVGDRVVVIADAHVMLDGRRVDEVWPGLDLQVGDVDGKLLWLCAKRPGWVERRNVIPLNEAAIERFTRMIQAEPEDVRLVRGRASLYAWFDKLDLAIKDYDRAIWLDPEGACYNDRALVWQQMGEYDKAIADYNQALYLDKNATSHVNRGSCWSAQGKYDQAMADYAEALRIDPRRFAAFRERGRTWLAQGELDKAIADFDEALRSDPKDAFAYNERGRAWEKKGDTVKALAGYRQAVRLHPGRAAYLENLQRLDPQSSSPQTEVVPQTR